MKILKVTQSTKKEIQFDKADFNGISMTDTIIIQDSETYDKSRKTLVIDWNFMAHRYWNLSGYAQDLIMDKLGVDRIEN